jgi:hypothetical protein
MTEKDKIAFKEIKEKIGESTALRLYDTLEDAVMEVEELKDELSTIVMTVTNAGRERWSTPEIKLGTGKKGRMRKDRYSAIVIANMIARTIHRALPAPTYNTIGMVVGLDTPSTTQQGMYIGPEWAQSIDSSVFRAINKNN